MKDKGFLFANLIWCAIFFTLPLIELLRIERKFNRYFTFSDKIVFHLVGKAALCSNVIVEVRNDLHGDTKNKKLDVGLRIALTLAGAFVDTYLTQFAIEETFPGHLTWLQFFKAVLLSSAIFVAFFDYAINYTMKVDGVDRPIFKYVSKRGVDAWPLWVRIGWKGRLAVRVVCLLVSLSIYIFL